LGSKWLLLPAIFCTILIFYLSVIDTSDFPELDLSHEDKYYHFIAYFVLNLMWLLVGFRYNRANLSLFLFISLAVIVFGIIIEVIQELSTDYRLFDNYDILANSFAVMVSFFFFIMVKKRILENIISNAE
jgi:VanZ family protein